MTPTEDQLLWDVVEEHLDESEFLVELWASARRSASYRLDELERGPEARLFAHVDGLVVNGPLALERVAWPVAEDPKAEPSRLCAAALALLEAGDFRVLGVLDEPRPVGEAEADEAEAVDELSQRGSTRSRPTRPAARPWPNSSWVPRHGAHRRTASSGSGSRRSRTTSAGWR